MANLCIKTPSSASSVLIFQLLVSSAHEAAAQVRNQSGGADGARERDAASLRWTVGQHQGRLWRWQVPSLCR